MKKDGGNLKRILNKRRHFEKSKGVPVVAQQNRIRLGTIRFQVQSLASLSGLGIWHCHELWFRSQRWLGSCIAEAAAALIRSLAWKIPCAVGAVLKSKKKKKKNERKKRLHAICFQLYDILKRQNYEQSKKISSFQALGGKERWIGRALRIFRAVKLLCMKL